jgi:acyl dehydratase
MTFMDDAASWWDAVSEGDVLPAIELPISYARVIAIPAATWDYFPGHHDPFYARDQGQETIYLSTMFYSGFLDRIVTDWAGPYAFIRARELTMSGSVYAGEQLTGRGQVRAKRIEASGMQVIDVQVSATSGASAGVDGLVTVTRSSELDRRVPAPSGPAR